MQKRGIFVRTAINIVSTAFSSLAALTGLFFLVWILFILGKYAVHDISWTLLSEPTKPYGIPDGGIANALVGTLLITFCAAVIAVPPGLLAGIYLSEFGKDTQIGNYIRFCANVMMGIPSIIVGLFVYALLVYTTKRFSGFAGSVALAIIMFPIILRTTEDMLNLVPYTLREAGLALGFPRWKVVVSIVFRAAKQGLITGVLLAIARVSGETAPLLFTALYSDSWPGLKSFFTEPTANLTVTITEYATNSPFEEMHARAWAGAAVITFTLLCINLICRAISGVKKYEQ